MRFVTELRVEVGDASLGVDVFKALLAIDMTASMKRAAQTLGMPYTTLWNLVARAERALGARLVETSRKGGTKLTEEGRRSLRLYMAEAARRGIVLGLSDFIYAGSHDPAVEEALRGGEAYFVGSLQGLLMVAGGLAHFGGVHLGDNLQAVAAYAPHLCLVQGFRREVGVATRRPIADLSQLANMRLVNRPPGAGTRIHIDRLLRQLGLAPREAPGYYNIALTHDEAAAKVAAGEAEYTVTTRSTAERYGLHFKKLWEEDFDFVCKPEACGKTANFAANLKLGSGSQAKENIGRVVCP
ncbi:transcriptional regulator of molybdate metabolism, LysR family [Pyrobaculum islandicum DSM 4184]|uniref:Transcriptional regulator of molybdate metabolism, LysR family n=1 Tax=Pyrobaculum islandicum (strain DSM 4184 / JCM 9189 / GEO3) TaxID=384616 RepID=A1RQJ7_PYRIL|nr:substrate-binding domain-containing protein [Pyrobaculum islandicum]ABL87229.1 transcriptional regulator of molybdate metabolism, LysR family [Pyrobaculum islandicum DSM 4184]